MFQIIQKLCCRSSFVNCFKEKQCSIIYNGIRFGTSFVVKRRYPIRLNKISGLPKKLKHRDYVYEILEKPSRSNLPKLDLILTKYATGFGERGTRILVDQNIGYNKLLLPGLATYATPETIDKFDVGDEVKTHSSAIVTETMEFIKSRVISVVMNKDNPWKIERWHVRCSFRKAGIHVLSDDCVILPDYPIEGPDLDKENKVFYVNIKINNREEVKAVCRIHHWSTFETDKLPYVQDHWMMPLEELKPPEKSELPPEKPKETNSSVIVDKS